jgi:hypothetical protein
MCDVYNADESGLYWRALPNNTYYVNEDECKGQKRSKERVTFLAITNWDGSDRKRLIVIGKSKNPRCFKNIKSLPVRYYANKTAWMQTDIFTEILNNWNKKLIKENRNILLFLDNCSVHSQNLNLSNIKIEFFPPNCTSVLQPLDMGIIKNIKVKYRSKLMSNILREYRKNKKVNTDFINLYDALCILDSAWNEVSGQTIYNCFNKC